MYVYFIQQGEKGPIKVGRSASPTAVLAGASEFNTQELTLLAQVAGDEALEKRVHRHLSRWRIKDDWYEANGEAIAYIEGLKRDSPDIPQRKTPMVAVTLPVEAIEKLARLSATTGESKSGVVRELILQADEKRPFTGR